MSNTFQWTDELVAEYHSQCLAGNFYSLEQFKKSKEEPERIEVILEYFVERFAFPKVTNSCLYVESPKKIPIDKFPAIKEAIENVLNDIILDERRFTEKDLEECWNIARYGKRTRSGLGVRYIHLFKNYLQSLNI